MTPDDAMQAQVGIASFIDTVTAQDNRGVLQARSSGKLYSGAKYANTYPILVEFDRNGTIRNVREYLDPDPVRDIRRPAVAHRRERGGAQG